MDVASRHLSMQGLGRVTKATEIDNHGGVELHLSAALHPAVVTGRLLGCWERAEGRGAQAVWKSTEDGHIIILKNRRDIA